MAIVLFILKSLQFWRMEIPFKFGLWCLGYDPILSLKASLHSITEEISQAYFLLVLPKEGKSAFSSKEPVTAISLGLSRFVVLDWTLCTCCLGQLARWQALSVDGTGGTLQETGFFCWLVSYLSGHQSGGAVELLPALCKNTQGPSLSGELSWPLGLQGFALQSWSVVSCLPASASWYSSGKCPVCQLQPPSYGLAVAQDNTANFSAIPWATTPFSLMKSEP